MAIRMSMCCRWVMGVVVVVGVWVGVSLLVVVGQWGCSEIRWYRRDGGLVGMVNSGSVVVASFVGVLVVGWS